MSGRLFSKRAVAIAIIVTVILENITNTGHPWLPGEVTQMIWISLFVSLLQVVMDDQCL